MSPLTDTSVIFKKLDWKPPSGAEHGRSRSRRPAEPSDPDPPRRAPTYPGRRTARRRDGRQLVSLLLPFFLPFFLILAVLLGRRRSRAALLLLQLRAGGQAGGGRGRALQRHGPAALTAALKRLQAPGPRAPRSRRRGAPLAPPAPPLRCNAAEELLPGARTPPHGGAERCPTALTAARRGGGQCGTERRGGGRTRCPGAVKLHRRATYSPWAGGGAAAAAAMLFIGAS